MYPRIQSPTSNGNRAKAKKVVSGGKRKTNKKNTPVINKHSVSPRKGPAETALKNPKMDSKTLMIRGREFIFKNQYFLVKKT